MWLADLLAQAAPTDGGDWITGIVSGLGSAGVSTGILWKIHGDSEKRHVKVEDELRADNRGLTSRLFLLADRGMEVGQTASEVVKADVKDPELLRQMQRLEALLEQRGRE